MARNEPGGGPSVGEGVEDSALTAPRLRKDPGRRDPSRAAGPGARKAGAVRPVMVALFVGLGLLGVVMLVVALTDGDWRAWVSGVLLVPISISSLAVLTRFRVRIDGSRLHTATPYGWTPVIDLDRLSGVRVSRAMDRGRVRPQSLHLRDVDGLLVRVDARTLDIDPLYRELAERVRTLDLDVDDGTSETLGLPRRDAGPADRSSS